MRWIVMAGVAVSVGCSAEASTDSRRPNESAMMTGSDGAATIGAAGQDAPAPTGCTLEGSIDIENTLDWMALVDSGCTTLVGALNIHYATFPRLPGASPLEVITDDLIVADSGSITSLVGLESLTSVLSLRIARNGALESLDGLDGLATVGGGIFIQDNGALTSIDALSGVKSVGQHVTVERNTLLPSSCVQRLVDGLSAAPSGNYINEGNAAGAYP